MAPTPFSLPPVSANRSAASNAVFPAHDGPTPSYLRGHLLPRRTDRSTTPQRSVHKPTLGIESLAWHLADLVRATTTGFTCDPMTGAAPRFGSEQFVVSLFGYEAIFRNKKPYELEIHTWLESCWSTLQKPGHYAGGWLFHGDSGTEFYLDVSVAVTGLERAVDMGFHHRQHSIFHPASNDFINLQQDACGIVMSDQLGASR